MSWQGSTHAQETIESLDDIGFVGFWACDFLTGDVRASDEVNRLFGVCLSAASRDLHGDYEARIHPDDLDWLRRERPRSVGPSGIGVVEYRVIDTSGRVRWMMCRGRYVTDEDGDLVSGRGVLFDVTNFKEEENRIRSSPAGIELPLIRVTDLILEAYAAAEKVGDADLLKALSLTLMTTGKLISKDLLVDHEEGSGADVLPLRSKGEDRATVVCGVSPTADPQLGSHHHR